MTELTVNNLLPDNLRHGDISNTSFIGIDFGTSTTVVSICRYDSSNKKFETTAIRFKQELEIPNEFHTSEKIPTVIAYLKCIGQNRIIIGQGAAELKYDYHFKFGKNIWYSFKTGIGIDLGALYYDCEIDNKAIKIRNPKDALRFFFKYLIKKTEAYIRENKLPENIKIALSVPASFEANQRKELINALVENGIMVTKQSLIDEPNAAFLSYVERSMIEGYQKIKIPIHRKINLLVFDFGAGTCDISILEIGYGDKNQGIESKNLSISKYYEIGGDDIDKFIALEYLLPQLAEQNELNVSDFIPNEIVKDILPKLLKASEQLKIVICENIERVTESNILPTQALSYNFEQLNIEIPIETVRNGKLILKNPKLSYFQFKEAMQVFCNLNVAYDKLSKPYTKYEYLKCFESIFNPIKTALKKSKLKIEELDYVLFIGGSSKNPYIRSEIKKYLKTPQILVPSDLQTHVSRGVAIHSLIFNGFNKNLVQPITSESIFLLTKNGLVTILKEGTSVPSEINIVDNLQIVNEKQDVIQLPIYVSNKNKLLFSLKWYVPENDYYEIGTTVKVAAEITPDKALLFRAFIEGKELIAHLLYPESTGEKSKEEREVLVAEKMFNLDAEKNGGIPPENSFKNLARSYKKANMLLKYANCLEEMQLHYPKSLSSNEIGVAIANAGDKQRASKYYKEAFEENPNNSTIAFNFALNIKEQDQEEFERLINHILENIDKNDPETLFEKGKIENRKNINSGKKFIEQAYDIYKEKFDKKCMLEFEFGWFQSVAHSLSKLDMVEIIEMEKPKINISEIIDPDTLVGIKQSSELIHNQNFLNHDMDN